MFKFSTKIARLLSVQISANTGLVRPALSNSSSRKSILAMVTLAMLFHALSMTVERLFQKAPSLDFLIIKVSKILRVATLNSASTK